jgi:tyrosine-protein phosphatase YwqE
MKIILNDGKEIEFNSIKSIEVKEDEKILIEFDKNESPKYIKDAIYYLNGMFGKEICIPYTDDLKLKVVKLLNEENR